RNDSDGDKKACKFEFTIANVRSTHERFDAATAKVLHQLYEMLIDYGAHPNPSGVLTALSKSETSDQAKFKVGILFPEQLTMVFALKLAVAVALGALKVFQLIYPERFTIAGLDLEIEELTKGLDSVFRNYRLPSLSSSGPAQMPAEQKQ